MAEIKEGMILYYYTCDDIELDLDGNTREVNCKIEHYLVQDIRKEKVMLYNLDNARVWNIEKNILSTFLYLGKMKVSQEEG